MKKTSLILILSTLICSCTPTPSIPIANASPVDSLSAHFASVWNHQDSAGVRQLFGNTVLLTDDDMMVTTPGEISSKWIHPNIRVVHNFKTTKLQDWSSTDRAGYTGKFEFDAIVNDSVVAHPAGIYTINWLRNENNQWLINTCIIYSQPLKR